MTINPVFVCTMTKPTELFFFKSTHNDSIYYWLHIFCGIYFVCWMCTETCNCLVVKINSHKLSARRKEKKVPSWWNWFGSLLLRCTVYFKWWIASVWLTEFGSLNEFHFIHCNCYYFFLKFHRTEDKVVVMWCGFFFFFHISLIM